MFQLRPYQELLVEGVRDEFRQGRRHTCVVAPCGAGKTVIMAWMAAQTAIKGNQVLFAVHRQELIDQSSQTFSAMNIPHGIIASGYPTADEQIQIGSIFTVARRLDRIQAPGVIIIDECFPAGTMIDGRPIETLKTGDVVTAWDEKQNKLVNGRVKSVFRRPANSLLRVQAGSFTVICTPNHPFLTQRGWIPAGLLSVSKDFILQIKDGGKNVSENAMPPMRKDAFIQRQKGTLQDMQGEGTAGKQSNSYYLLRMRQAGNAYQDNCERQSQIRFIQEERPGLLFRPMQGYSQEPSQFSYNDQDQQKICLGANEEKESYAQTGNTCKDECNTQGQRVGTACKRWKRKRADGTPKTSCQCSQLACRGCHSNKNAKEQRIPNLLQGGHRQSRIEDRNRIGRSLPFRQEIGGSQKGKTAYWTRVDNIEILEPGSDGTFGGLCPDGYVYNFEVEKYHTYTANGFVVHNCHHSTANTWRKLLAAYPEAYVIGLTATPARLGGEGLGDIFESLVLGPSVSQLINWGNLAPYRYYAPPIKANLEGLRVRYGEYVRSDIALRMDRSEIIGDAIEQYKKLANGKRAVCYCVGRAHSEHTAEMFREAGIPAAHIDGETQDTVRKVTIEQFRAGEIWVLCNVDLISEGFDVPAMEAVILMRPTQSLTLHIQQSMRPMRPDEGNPDKVAVIIDHVGNVYRHGLPDEDRPWSLEGSKKKSQSSPREVALRQCPKCYAAHRPAPLCPLCGYKYAPAERSEPTQRRGELVKIDELERKRRRQEVGRARNITDLEQIALRRGYSLRWIAKMAEVKRIPVQGDKERLAGQVAELEKQLQELRVSHLVRPCK